MKRAFCVLIAISLARVPGLIGQEKGGGDETGAYEVVEGWLKPPNPAGWVPGPITAIFAESPDRVFVIERGDPILGRSGGQPVHR